jgi:hypothetical protein
MNKTKTWRDDDIWFRGAMVHPNTDDAIQHCKANGVFFPEPNAWFVEGFEEGDCDSRLISYGDVPGLGERTDAELKEIWEECFSK